MAPVVSNTSVYIYSKTPSVSGIKIIIDHLASSLEIKGCSVSIISDIGNLPKESFIIPYGIIEANEVIKFGFKTNLVLMVDAYTLGCKNYFTKDLERRNFLNKRFFRFFLSYFYYSIIEKKVLEKFSRIMLVSDHDKKYLEERFNTASNKFLVTPNGVNIPEFYKKRENFSTNTCIKMGVIAYWSPTAFYDILWFLDDFFPEIIKQFPKIKIVVAGRGASDEMVNYFQNHEHIEYLGEVDDTSYFYDEIDIYLSTVIKECGILNKVLEAFANSKLVIGFPHNFYPFNDLENGYLTFNSCDELLDILRDFERGKIDSEVITGNALRYVKENHNWDINYELLAENILDQLKVLKF